MFWQFYTCMQWNLNVVYLHPPHLASIFINTASLLWISFTDYNFWFGFVTISFNQGHLSDHCIRTITRAWWGNQWILSWRQQLPVYLNISVSNNSAVSCKVTFSLLHVCFAVTLFILDSVKVSSVVLSSQLQLLYPAPNMKFQISLTYYFEFLYSFFSFFWNIAHVIEGLSMSYLGLRTYPLLSFIIL